MSRGYRYRDRGVASFQDCLGTRSDCSHANRDSANRLCHTVYIQTHSGIDFISSTVHINSMNVNTAKLHVQTHITKLNAYSLVIITKT